MGGGRKCAQHAAAGRDPCEATPSLGHATEDPRGPSVADRLWLERLDVRSRGALGTLLGFIVHFCALGQRPKAVALDGAVMHEQVLAGIIGDDESETLVV